VTSPPPWRADQLVGDSVPPQVLYASTKRALSQSVRRVAPAEEWAGANIALNAVAPGVVRTPMTTTIMRDPARRERMSRLNPMPLKGFADVDAPANLLAWLASEQNSHLCGQVIYADGGTEALLRGDTRW
jgi:NAD(P)-dependent dehydrogenase (short-subunit alcohol dehydrogenase family)